MANIKYIKSIISAIIFILISCIIGYVITSVVFSASKTTAMAESINNQNISKDNIGDEDIKHTIMPRGNIIKNCDNLDVDYQTDDVNSAGYQDKYSNSQQVSLKINVNNKVDFEKLKNNCKSYYLVEPTTNTVLASNNENERHKIASMVKIMTSLIVFDEIKEGRQTLDTMVTISENSSKMGGSQLFLDKDTKHKLGDLLKSVVVCSANDSAVALAEHIAGSEEAFVAKMNEKAKNLGMENTLFCNATGLPKENQYSTAKDVSLMFRELLKNDKYYEFCKVWLEEYTHPDGRKTSMTNTNKLVRFYSGCDAGKTGYTDEALHCLTATAKRDNMRVIAVMIGANSSSERFDGVSGLFNYAFANYKNAVVINKNDKVATVKVVGGREKSIDLLAKEPITVFSKIDAKPEFKGNVELNSVKAPIKKGDTIAKLKVMDKNNNVQYFDLIASGDIDKANYLDSVNDIFGNW